MHTITKALKASRMPSPQLSPEPGERLFTELDHVRLSRLVERQPHEALEDLLATTPVVPSRHVPDDVVTMNSRIELSETPSGRKLSLTLCYPADANPAEGRVSVLSPVGVGLIGQRLGARATWRLPNGQACAADVVAITFQPEACGHYTV